MEINPTIIAAVIAALTSFISSLLTLYSIKVTKKGNEKNIESNEEISKKVQEAENKRTESRIDANIVWNARVEWIQNVRRVTAEFITACYKYIQSNESDKNEQNHNLELIQQQKSLLILYFGPDGTESNKKKAQNICDKDTNNAKNEMIVALINELFNQLKTYFIIKEELNRCRAESGQCCRCENAESKKLYLCEKNEYGDKFTEDDCKASQKKWKNSEKNYKQQCNKVFDNIDLLTKAMRIYLKIEWTCTKNREK